MTETKRVAVLLLSLSLPTFLSFSVFPPGGGV
uniref:Uncharacterized protein n=1 Tax=Rhizophora mucronata TaxID=61149 RepID=A0A2P2NQ41_RHIMU